MTTKSHGRRRNNDDGDRLEHLLSEPRKQIELSADQCRKRGVDMAVAVIAAKPIKEVRFITDLFLAIAMQELVSQGELHIDGFGTFRLKAYAGKAPAVEEFKRDIASSERTLRFMDKVEVRFKKAPAFRRLLQRHRRWSEA